MEKSPSLTLLSAKAPQIEIRHPDTRAPQHLSVTEYLFRVETSLGLALDPHWVPLLVAMADGLYMHESKILHRAYTGLGYVERPPTPNTEALHSGTVDAMAEAGVILGRRVEDIFRAGEWGGLERPRTWELNGWWEALYGAIPMPPAQDEEDEEAVDEGDGLDLGARAHPFGLQSPDNEVRTLLEGGLLSQGETLYRLRVSIFEQERALGALRAGWRLDQNGLLTMPATEGLSPRRYGELEMTLGTMNRGEKAFDPEAANQLIALGLARRVGVYLEAL